MQSLIIKLGATGDVVRTTPLLRQLKGNINWLTSASNRIILGGVENNVQCIAWEERASVRDVMYDLVINLEDTGEVADFVATLRYGDLYGAYKVGRNEIRYTDSSNSWFDLSLISRFGKQRADELKFCNRKAYQELIFEGLGFSFDGESYLLPSPQRSVMRGDVAIAPKAGPVWEMKNWAYYTELKALLEARGLQVNVLPWRQSLLEHMGDISQHRCLVGGDSLPMHLALGLGVPCVTIFNCTSPWEIWDYGIQKKLVSPLLGEFFYGRGFDRRAVAAVGIDDVLHAVVDVVGSGREA